MLITKLNNICDLLHQTSIFNNSSDLIITSKNILNCLNSTSHKAILYNVELYKIVCINNAFKQSLFLNNNNLKQYDLFLYYLNNIHPDNLLSIGQILKFVQLNSKSNLSLFLTLRNNDNNWVEFYSVSKIIEISSSRYLLTLLEETDKLPKKWNIKTTISNNYVSRTEQYILRYLYRDLTTKEIADLMHVSVNTIHSHRQNLIKKLQVNSSHGLVRKAIELGLTTSFNTDIIH